MLPVITHLNRGSYNGNTGRLWDQALYWGKRTKNGGHHEERSELSGTLRGEMDGGL